MNVDSDNGQRGNRSMNVEDTLDNQTLAELISYISPPALLSSGAIGQ